MWKSLGRPIGVLMFFFASAELATAQTIYVPRHRHHWDSQWINRQLDASEKALDSAVKIQRELLPKFADARAKSAENEREYKQTLSEVRAEYDRDPELVKARADYSRAQSDFEDAKAHVLRLIKDSPPYVTALAQRARAAEQLRAISPGDAQARQQAAKASAQAMSEVTRLENEAVAADPAAASAHRRHHETSDRVAELVAKRDRAFAADQRIKSAKLGRERAKEEFQQVQQQLYLANANVAQAEHFYQAMVQQRIAWERYENAQHGGWGWGGYRPWRW